MARDDPGDDDGAAPEDESQIRRPFRKILLLGLPLALALLGGGGWLFATGRLNGMIGLAGAAAPSIAPRQVYYEFPEMLVNMRAAGPRPVYLRLRGDLELGKASDKAIIDSEVPLLTDSLEVDLRQLRVDDLKDPRVMKAFRSELTAELNLRLKPVAVKDVLFTEMQIARAQ